MGYLLLAVGGAELGATALSTGDGETRQVRARVFYGRTRQAQVCAPPFRSDGEFVELAGVS
jgi:hypothetical protein